MCECALETELKEIKYNYIVGKSLKVKQCCFYSLLKELLEKEFGDRGKNIIEWADTTKRETWEDNVDSFRSQYIKENGSENGFTPPAMPVWMKKRLGK